MKDNLIHDFIRNVYLFLRLKKRDIISTDPIIDTVSNTCCPLSKPVIIKHNSSKNVTYSFNSPWSMQWFDVSHVYDGLLLGATASPDSPASPAIPTSINRLELPRNTRNPSRCFTLLIYKKIPTCQERFDNQIGAFFSLRAYPNNRLVMRPSEKSRNRNRKSKGKSKKTQAVSLHPLVRQNEPEV